MLLACLWIEHLPVKAELQRNPSLRGRPLVLAQLSGSRRVVIDTSSQAVGITAGMPLAEALSQCKNAFLVEPDPTYYQSVFDGAVATIEGLGAQVEEAALGTAYLQLTGLELLFGGEDHLITALLQAVPEYLAPRFGVAGNKFSTYVAAGAAAPGTAFKAPADLASFLAPLPVDLLPVLWETKLRLRSFGLSTLGRIAELPAGALQAQFGPTGRLLWELANGIDPRPLVPRSQQEVVSASLTFLTPVATMDAIVASVDSLLGRAFAGTEMRGRFARVCFLAAAVFRAPAWHKRMVFREPIGDRRKAGELIKHALQGHPPPGPLEDLHLTLAGLTGEAGRQESFFSEVRKQENLKEALQQLRARLGGRLPIYQVREIEPWSRLPERRRVLVPYAP